VAALLILVVLPAGRMGENPQAFEPAAPRGEPQPSAD